MIEVYKTNIKEKKEAEKVIPLLSQRMPGSKINIDLHDIDNVLRIEAGIIRNNEVIELLNSMDFYCEPLPD